MANRDDEDGAEVSTAGQSAEIDEPGQRETAEMQAVLTDAAELFRSSELFQGLTPEEVREIIHASEHQVLEAEERLFEQGDPSEALYVIQSGEVQVYSHTPVGEEVVLAELGPGSVVGEMSIIGGGTRSASVEALGRVELFRLSREAFQSLRSQDRPAAYKIIVRLTKTLGERRRTTDARIQEVFDDPDEHLDEFEEQVHEMLGKIRKA